MTPPHRELRVVNRATGEVVSTVDVTGKSERKIERVLTGMAAAKAKDESIDVYYITASDDDIFDYEDGDPEEMLYVKRSDHLADKNAALAAKIDEISILSAKLAAMREPLWMLRSEHEAEIADLRARLEAAEARAARWVDIHDTPSFSALYDAGWRGRDGENDRKVDGRWLRLLCPPVPLPETKP